MSIGMAVRDVSISSRNVSSFGGFLQYTTSFRDTTSKSRGGLHLVRVGYSQHYLFVQSIDLVGFLGGSVVVVRHLAESKMAHSHRADE
jgi:hypothetical protein